MNNRTTWKSVKDVKRSWYEIDATGMSLGRLAGKIAKYLMGKTSPEYVPNLDMGHFVIVTNAGLVKLTGKKESYLTLQRYTGYPSGLKKTKVSELMKNRPEKVIHSAVKGMLPDTRLKDSYLSRLHIYTEATHPHEAQKPTKITV
ncbi:MAG: 50S ribosomal protein L13 [Candidatus Dojkabacteria bacterium]|nr:MAG: 50S ribosomal protein L13 [Candidatus Dojkabacteria bacterium]